MIRYFIQISMQTTLKSLNSVCVDEININGNVSATSNETYKELLFSTAPVKCNKLKLHTIYTYQTVDVSVDSRTPFPWIT